MTDASADDGSETKSGTQIRQTETTRPPREPHTQSRDPRSGFCRCSEASKSDCGGTSSGGPDEPRVRCGSEFDFIHEALLMYRNVERRYDADHRGYHPPTRFAHIGTYLSRIVPHMGLPAGDSI